MTKETLSGWPKNLPKKKWFREKVGDLFWALRQNKLEEKERIKKMNDKLVGNFHEKNRWRKDYEYKFKSNIREKDILNDDSIDWISFDSTTAVKKAISERYVKTIGWTWLLPHWKTIEMELNGSLKDNKYILEHISMHNRRNTCLLISLYDDMVKDFIKNVDISGCNWCCFDFHMMNTKSSKEIIKWFTKLWKQGKITDCIIKINWKEYHSSGNYKYEFE